MSDQVLWGVSNDIHVATLLIACGGFGGGGGGGGGLAVITFLIIRS